MTLIITVLTKKTIYQSADFRLANGDTLQPLAETATKLVTLQYLGWHGFVGYTGIGKWRGKDTSHYLKNWLNDFQPAGPEEAAERIREKGTEWLNSMGKALHHSFILAAFHQDVPVLSVISNFEDSFGRNEKVPQSSLTISSRRFGSAPGVVVCGWKAAVSRLARRRLKRIIRESHDDPRRVRLLLTEINAQASVSSNLARKVISPECSVVSFRTDGQGVFDSEGPVTSHSILLGQVMPDPAELAKSMGFPGRVAGAAFSSSRPRQSFAACQPQVTTPPSASGYTLCEISHADIASNAALVLNDAGTILGAGYPRGRPGDRVVWIASRRGDVKLSPFLGDPGGINSRGEVVAQARMRDGSARAVRWQADAAPRVLGSYRGKDSGAAAVNSSGMVVGWVCIDAVDRGQSNFRPAIWSDDKPDVLENFGYDWGTAFRVTDGGLVLVSGHLGWESRAILWDPRTGTLNAIGSATGIYAMAMTNDGIVLGTARDTQGEQVAYLGSLDQGWKPLGTLPGFYATAMNNEGDVVGTNKKDGYERPWLRRRSDEMVWLPYFEFHSCRPFSINDRGTIVGTASTDHGTHALVWEPIDTSGAHNSS